MLNFTGQTVRAVPRTLTRLLVIAGAVGILAAGCTSSTAEEESATVEPITEAAVLFPIAADQLDNWRTALADLIGPSYADYESSRGRFGLEQQTTFLQGTPMGNFALIYMEGPDLNNTVEQMTASPEPWDVNWREMTTGLHGTDFNDPAAIAFDSHLVLDTGSIDDEQKRETTPFNFFIPLDPSTVDDLSADLQMVMEERADEYRQARTDIGVAEEKVFLQNTAVGPGLVIYWEAVDPEAAMQQLIASENPFDVWFQERFASYHGVPVDVLAPIWADNELIADFPRR